jgi:hypothetical protein
MENVFILDKHINPTMVYKGFEIRYEEDFERENSYWTIVNDRSGKKFKSLTKIKERIDKIIREDFNRFEIVAHKDDRHGIFSKKVYEVTSYIPGDTHAWMVEIPSKSRSMNQVIFEKPENSMFSSTTVFYKDCEENDEILEEANKLTERINKLKEKRLALLESRVFLDFMEMYNKNTKSNLSKKKGEKK